MLTRRYRDTVLTSSMLRAVMRSGAPVAVGQDASTQVEVTGLRFRYSSQVELSTLSLPLTVLCRPARFWFVLIDVAAR